MRFCQNLRSVCTKNPDSPTIMGARKMAAGANSLLFVFLFYIIYIFVCLTFVLKLRRRSTINKSIEIMCFYVSEMFRLPKLSTS